MSSAPATRTASAPATTLRTKRETVMIPWSHIQEDPNQPRTYFNAAAMEALRGSIDNSDQKLAAVVRPIQAEAPVKYMIVDGARRWRTARDLNIPLECIIRTDMDDPFVRRKFQVQANWNRQPHTLVEAVQFLRDMMKDPEIEAIQSMADKYVVLGRWFGHPPQWVRQHLGLLRLHPDLFARLGPDTPKNQRFPKTVAYTMSCVSHKEQLAYAEKIDSGKLNAVRAKRHMAQSILEKGQTAVGHRGRKPSDNIELFRTFLKHLKLNGEGLQEMSEKDFNRMIASRPVSERRAITKQLGEALTMLHDIKRRVEKVPDNQVSGK